VKPADTAPADFARRYGEWAVVTGASSGIGEAFAYALASRGVQSLLVARRREELARVAANILQNHGISSDILVADLAGPAGVEALRAACDGRDVGLVVSNAAFNPPGAFLDHAPEIFSRMLDVNCRASMLLANIFLPRFLARGRGGFLLVGSTEGFSGSPFSAVYSATKAFTLSFGEALWGEFRAQGVDILVLVPGATDTPLLASRKMQKVSAMPPGDVAEIGLINLPHGPYVVAGRSNKWMMRILRRLPRKWSVLIIGGAMQKVLKNLKK
jgi:short-subunit dehydrogenase